MERRGYPEERRRSEGRRRPEEWRWFPERNADPDRHLRRAPVVEGIFYPDNREAMINQIASWGVKEGSSTASLGGQVIIAPHGAWDISGKIAGAAFATVQAGSGGDPGNKPAACEIERVILLGPCHSPGEQGIYLSESVVFETPLGDLPVDWRVNRKLASCSSYIREDDIFHLSEHSLEVLLPLIKYCFPDVKIVPILVHGSAPVLISGLAKALWVILENCMEKSLIVISSNVSVSCDSALASSMAEEFCSVVSGMDTRGFLARLSDGRINACGGAIIAALFESGLLTGRHFSALTPLSHGTEEDRQIVYYSAFAAKATTNNRELKR